MDIKYALKNNFILRAAIKPYIDYFRTKELKRYSHSTDSAYIHTLKDKYLGKRCFIVGNGPSLNTADLELISSEYSFGTNRIYKIFGETEWRPDFYFAVDNSFIESSWRELLSLNIGHMFLATDANFDFSVFGDKATRIFEYTKFKVNMWNDMTAHISTDVSKYFSVGYTVTFTAIQMAMYMGFRDIYLIGVDFDYSVTRDKKGRIKKNDSVKDYFFGEKYKSTVLNYNSALNAYEVARKYADSHNIKIYNATRGGKLEVFERADLNKVIKSAGGGITSI